MIGTISHAIQPPDNALNKARGDVMRFLAQVAVVFGTDVARQYDLWEYFISFDSSSPSEAVKTSIRLTEQTFDIADNLQKIGYDSKPVLCAVKALHTDVGFPHNWIENSYDITMLFRVATISDVDAAALASYEKVLIPYNVIYIGQ
jgi:hypothetical protein